MPWQTLTFLNYALGYCAQVSVSEGNCEGKKAERGVKKQGHQTEGSTDPGAAFKVSQLGST